MGDIEFTVIQSDLLQTSSMADFSDVPASTSRLDFDPLSPPPNPDPNSRPGTEESGSDQSDLNFFFYEYEEEQMNFVTDLFRHADDDGESEVILGFGSSPTDGLRVVDMDSESDSEAMEVDYSGVIHEIENENDDLGSPGFWDCLQYDNNPREISLSEEFEWEEVNLRENLSSMIDRMEQLSFPSSSESPPFVTEVEEDEENVRNVEWQVLLDINNNLDIASGYEEYNVQFGELVGDSTVRGSPPAAKKAVGSLQEDVLKSNVVCAVCKDEMPVGVKVPKLPCSHHYHRDCILPWLAIRNTCPLCRHELPTDDVDYERRKNRADREL